MNALHAVPLPQPAAETHCGGHTHTSSIEGIPRAQWDYCHSPGQHEEITDVYVGLIVQSLVPLVCSGPDSRLRQGHRGRPSGGA